MATAGHTSVVKATDTYNADASTGYNAVEVLSASFAPGVDLLDVTALTDGQFRKRIQGLKDLEMSLTCDFIVAGSSSGQSDIRDSYDDDQQVYMVFLPDGTNGYHVPMVCEGYGIDVEVEGKVGVTYTLRLNVDSNLAGIIDVGSP